LWNLATEEIKVIPPNLPEFSREVMIGFTLHGFGYDHVRDDYKVIQHVDYTVFDECTLDDDDDDDDSFWFWEIYNLKSNSWRKLSFDMPRRFLSANDKVYFNGMCHWLGETFDETYVVSFNLGNDRFFLTPLPFEYTPFCFYVSLMVLNGFVTMISNHKETKSFHISILGEFGVKESWVRLFNIGPLSCIERPIGAGKNGNIFFKHKEDELVCLNLTTGMIEKIDIKEEMCWCKMITYKKNLHPIGGINK
jgi:F-box interacting protein